MCELAYGIEEPHTAVRQCTVSDYPEPWQESPRPRVEWLAVDGQYTVRLEDYIAAPKMQINRADVAILISFQSSYIPWRSYQWFGFESAKGSDGKLYWRAYIPQ